MAGRITQRFIDDILSRVDIVDLVDSRVPLKKRGKEHMACCPFHGEKTPSFTVSEEKQFYHCFGCGAHGTAISFLMEYEHLEFVEAIEMLAQNLGLEVEREGGSDYVHNPQTDVYAALESAEQYYRQQLKKHARAIDYLKGRGVSGETAAEYALGYAPPGWDGLKNALAGSTNVEDLKTAGLLAGDGPRHYDRLRNRVIFSIRDSRGRVIGFGGRALDDDGPKYLNSPETPVFHKGRSLYGLYEARKALGKMERILIVEGYMDVIALVQYGIRNVVATLGTATTRDHLQLLYRQARELVFCFDGDRAGRDAAWRALEQLLPLFRDGLEARFLFLPEGTDPDSLVRDEGQAGFLARVEEAVPLAEFLFNHLASQTDQSTPAGRARFAELARPLVSQLPDGVFRELMYQDLGQRVGVSAEKLYKPPAEPTRPAEPQRRQGGLSPVRMAISLLLNMPRLSELALRGEQLARVDVRGMDILCKLLETLQEDPHLTPPALVERFRSSDSHPHLLKLMQWQPPSQDEDSLRQTFTDVMANLARLGDEQRTEFLLDKARANALSEPEKTELAAILKSSA